MATIYIEPRPKSRAEGARIEYYVAETEGDILIETFPTQEAAIVWGRNNGHILHIARVRHLSDKRNPDHWRVFAVQPVVGTK
jgi:hypothetical protein